MANGVMDIISETLIEGYNLAVSFMPDWGKNFISLFLIIILIFLYSLFVWKFYRFVATKNIFGLDLNKYNKSTDPFFTKVVAGIFYLIEYIIILPFAIFFWFSVFALFLIFLTEELEISTILIIAAAIIAAIRMASYYKEDLSKDLAKLIPFTLLAVSILTPGFFKIERILGQFTEIPSLFNNIVIYLIFIILLEIILRSFDFIFSLFGIEDEEPEETEEESSAGTKTGEEG